MAEKYKCEICGSSYTRKHKSEHLQTKKHLRAAESANVDYSSKCKLCGGDARNKLKHLETEKHKIALKHYNIYKYYNKYTNAKTIKEKAEASTELREETDKIIYNNGGEFKEFVYIPIRSDIIELVENIRDCYLHNAFRNKQYISTIIEGVESEFNNSCTCNNESELSVIYNSILYDFNEIKTYLIQNI